jgi:hypothetical protein
MEGVVVLLAKVVEVLGVHLRIKVRWPGGVIMDLLEDRCRRSGRPAT